MKAESTIRPVAPFETEMNGDTCFVRFFENVIETQEEENTKFEYDEYVLELKYRIGIELDIENNLDVWIKCARDTCYNKCATKVRNERDRLLFESDKYLLQDYPINDVEREKIMKYRQSLRDITQSDNFPYEIEFPVLSFPIK